MRAFSPATPPARRPTSVGSFNPASISGLRSRLLDANTFTSPIDSKYYLKDSSTTNTHLPRQGRCWLFDGSNDQATSTAADLKLISSNASFSICGWIKATASAGGIAATWNGSLGFSCYYRNDLLRVYKDSEVKSFATTLVADTWYHLTYVLNGVSVEAYINGVSIGASQSFANATISSGGSFFVGQSSSVATAPASSVRDVRIYNVAKTAGEVSAIYNQSRTGSGIFDSTGLVAAYPCNEESGTTGYDISGNGNHLTLTNITQATFHAADTGVTANRNNAEGYRLSGSVYIPKRLTDSLAADGNALTVSGRAAYHGCAETPCVTGNGTDVRVELASQFVPLSADFELSICAYFDTVYGSFEVLVGQVENSGAWLSAFGIGYTGGGGSWIAFFGSYTANKVNFVPNGNAWNTISIRKVGTTLFCSLNGGAESSTTCAASITAQQNTRLLMSAGGSHSNTRIADFRITTGGATTYFPLQDGPGSSNTNRDIAWVKSDGTGGVISNAIVNGTVSTIWGNRVPGNVEDWCVKYGGRIAANGAFIAGMLTGGNAADGSAKTLTAGKFGNPFSRLNLNPATAAELNGKNIQTAYEDLPCVTGNGTNLYVDLGSSSFSVVGSTIRCAFLAPSGGSGGNTNKRIASRRNPSLQGWELYVSGGNNLVLFIGDGSGFTEHILATSILRDTWMLLDLTVSGSTIGSAITGSVNGVAISTTLPRAILESASNTNLLGSNAMTSYADTRLSGLSVTASGTTTYFPLSDGSGADLAWYKSDGTKGVISTALQGTLTNVWANKTNGSKVAATKYALRAIVTRETEFNRVASDGDDRFLIYDNALSGADLTNIEGYLV